MILWRTNQKLVLEKRQLAEALNVSTLQVAVTCPTCQRKLTIGTAATFCPGCGLQMKLILEEPRCQSCGYSLLMISSDRCPECGALKAPHSGLAVV
jgi:rubrerythrin